MRSEVLAFSAVLCCVAISGSARADPAEDGLGSGLRIVYDATDECPSREAFWEKWLELRGSAGEDVPELDAGVVRVTLRRTGAEFVARLVMVDGTGECGAQRTLSAPDCTELVADVAASLDLAVRDWTCAPPPEPSCPTPAPEPQVAPQCAPAPDVQPRSAADPRWGELGVVGGLLWFAPEQGGGAWGQGVLLGYHSSPRRGRGGGLPWSVQGQVGHWMLDSLSAEVAGNDLDLRLRLTSARLSVCPLEVPLAGPLAVPLCATVEAGVVAVRVGEEDQSPLFWSALGVAPRLRASTKALFAEVEPSVAFPIMRYRVEGGREVMDWIAPAVQIRLGVRF